MHRLALVLVAAGVVWHFSLVVRKQQDVALALVIPLHMKMLHELA
jgi:hypothetical protein